MVTRPGYALLGSSPLGPFGASPRVAGEIVWCSLFSVSSLGSR